jgi:hypothetical protein
MVLNQFFQQHRALPKERRKCKGLKRALRQQRQIDLVTAGLQKVSAELEWVNRRRNSSKGD